MAREVVVEQCRARPIVRTNLVFRRRTRESDDIKRWAFGVSLYGMRAHRAPTESPVEIAITRAYCGEIRRIYRRGSARRRSRGVRVHPRAVRLGDARGRSTRATPTPTRRRVRARATPLERISLERSRARDGALDVAGDARDRIRARARVGSRRAARRTSRRARRRARVRAIERARRWGEGAVTVDRSVGSRAGGDRRGPEVDRIGSRWIALDCVGLRVLGLIRWRRFDLIDFDTSILDVEKARLNANRRPPRRERAIARRNAPSTID